MTVTESNSPNNNTVVITADDSTAISPLNFFTAETLLGDSPFMGPVLRLRDSISRQSDGTVVDYDATIHRLKDEVDALPTLELQQDVPAGAEGTYQRQLLHALEKINDDHDRVSRKLLKIKSRLVNAITLMKNQRSQFVAYYSLAYPTAVRNSNGVGQKLSVKGIENLASGEYSRIMDNLDSAAVSLISEITILEMEIKSRKAASAAKYQLGKDQVNLIWNSFQSQGAIGLDDDPGSLLKKLPVEEDDEEVPSFVSRHTKEVRVGASIIKPPDTGTHTLCSVCMKPQFSTPNGDTCSNGHGGADPYVEDENEFRTRGTFYKRGDPQPIRAIVVDGASLPEGETWSEPDEPEVFTESKTQLGEREPKNLVVEPFTEPLKATLHVGVDEERADPDYSVTAEYDADWVEIKPDAEGLAAIGEIARKANAETMAKIEADREAKSKKIIIVRPDVDIDELMKLRAPIDACEDDFSNEPLVVDYRAKWDKMGFGLQPAATKSILIEDIQDSPPDTMQEAAKLMEDATLGELELPDFKLIPSKVFDFIPLYIAQEKVVPADDFESIMNVDEPLATTATTTPRKKLMLMEEDEF